DKKNYWINIGLFIIRNIIHASISFILYVLWSNHSPIDFNISLSFFEKQLSMFFFIRPEVGIYKTKIYCAKGFEHAKVSGIAYEVLDFMIAFYVIKRIVDILTKASST